MDSAWAIAVVPSKQLLTSNRTASACLVCRASAHRQDPIRSASSLAGGLTMVGRLDWCTGERPWWCRAAQQRPAQGFVPSRLSLSPAFDRHPMAATLAIRPLDRRPGDPECSLLIAAVFVPGVVERLAEDVLSVLRQMFRNRKWKLIVGRIGRGDYKMGTTTDDTRHTTVSRARMRKLSTRSFVS